MAEQAENAKLPINVQKVRKHLKDTFKLSPDRIEFVLLGAQQSMTEQFASAFDALSKSDWGALSLAAHSIKGALLNLGDTHWAEYAKEIELAAKAEDEKDYFAALHGLKEGLAPLFDEK